MIKFVLLLSQIGPLTIEIGPFDVTENCNSIAWILASRNSFVQSKGVEINSIEQISSVM